MRAGETNTITVLFCREGALRDKYMFMVLNITFVCVCVQCCVLRCVRCTGFRQRIKDGCWSGNRCQRRRCRSLYPNSYWARSYASTRAGQCWCLSSVERLRSVLKFYLTEWLKFWQENESFCSFYCREAQKHESFFHNVDAYGKNKKQPVIVFLRIQEVKELGDLSPHWNELRHDVINHCNHLIGCYQEMLAELDKLSGEVD